MESKESDLNPETPVGTEAPLQLPVKAGIRDVGSLVGTYVKRHLPETGSTEPDGPGTPPQITGTHDKALVILRFIPATLALMFVASFFWDFPNSAFQIFGTPFSLTGLLRITAVSGLIGFFTNWLAITMLFQPRQKRPIFGQGLIPAQRERVIYRLATAVSEELINEEIIKQRIQDSGVISKYKDMGLGIVRDVIEDPDFRTDLKGIVQQYVRELVGSEEVRTRLASIAAEKLESHAGQGLSGLALRTYRYFKEDEFQERIDKAILELPTAVDSALDGADTFLDTIPDRIEERSGDIEKTVTGIVLGFVGQLNVYDMVIENMRKYDDQKLENLIKSSSNEQLNYIKYLGGVLGVIGGLVIWEPILSLICLATVGLILFSIDQILFNIQKQA